MYRTERDFRGSFRRRATARLGRRARALSAAGALAAALLAATGVSPAGAAGAPAPADGASLWSHIAAGGYHTCGIRIGGTLWCWGNNRYGELGIGTILSQNQPQQITQPATHWVSVSAGGLHSCAIRRDTTLWCWGNNDYGQLGIGATTSDVTQPQQVTSPAAGGWASVTAGGFGNCALRLDTTLWCWGGNGTGRSYPDLPQPVTAPAATGWAAAAAGSAHTCALRSDGTLWCWGAGESGQLGLGTTASPSSPQPVTTPSDTGWTSVTAGDRHTCAVRVDTTLWCWGWDRAGQVGIGSKISQYLPQQVITPAATGWTRVTAGGNTTCARRRHKLWCWGFNRYGQLGVGNTTNQSRPRHVVTPSGASWNNMAVGTLHTCATHAGHALWCWGYNGVGQLGLGHNSSRDVPQPVTT